MLTSRFADAFAFAEALHRAQRRKGTDIPYIVHPMAVASLVLEHGGGEDESIAGLLHDAVEDQGGLATARVISERFGPRVAQIVLGCTDAIVGAGEAKAPWRTRKSAFIARLARAPASVGLVVACDKLHNLSCLIADVEREGPSTLARFAQPADFGWYYGGVAEALRPVAPPEPVRQLRRLVGRFADCLGDCDVPMGSLHG